MLFALTRLNECQVPRASCHFHFCQEDGVDIDVVPFTMLTCLNPVSTAWDCIFSSKKLWCC